MPESADEIYEVRTLPVLLEGDSGRTSRWVGFGETMAKVWKYVLGTLAVAIIFWAFARYLPNESFRTLLAHLGTAAFTSAVVGFVYAWHASQTPAGCTLKERFWSTLQNCFLYCACGVAIATGMWTLLLLRHYDAQTEEILTHIAGAFFVSAIVIFGYEWGSEAKRAADLATKLAFVLHGQIKKVIDATSRDAVAHGLLELVGPKSVELTEQFEWFAEALKQLGSVRDWAAAGYLAFVQNYFATMTDNVRKLAAFTGRRGSEDFQIKIPSAATIADVMVNATMQKLRAIGGKYDAVSDAKTWKELLNFGQAQKVVVVEGEEQKRVDIRRIFVLGKPADARLTVGEVAKIIVEHYDDARASNGHYQIRITDTEEHITEATGIVGDAHHFGIFRPTDDKPIVFSVHDENMSQFKVMTASKDMIDRFENLWKLLKPLGEASSASSKDDDRIIRDYLLAYSIRRMSQRSEYRGVSKVTTWQNRSFARFLAASEDALRTRDVAMKRLLVVDDNECFDKPELLEATIEILLEHDTLCGRTEGKYQWRLCRASDWTPDMKKEIAFGLFSDPSTDPIVADADVSVENRPFVKEIDKKEYVRFYNAFDAVWAHATSWDASIRRVFGSETSTVSQRLTHAPKE
jgi:hypothetical protein